MPAAAKVRLHVAHPVGEGQTVPLDRDQAHYLFGVMRMGAGDRLFVFNQTSGEWLAEVLEAGKRGGVLQCVEKTRERRMPADVWLLFAPIRKERTDFVVEKATELGAAVIQPVRTEFTQSDRVRTDRLQAHAIEATEQCGGTYVPEVRELQPLDRVLAAWPEGRRLMFCDERLAGPAAGLGGAQRGPWAILIGPEGGFSDAERLRLAALPCAVPVGLGPRILRADTAAVAALTLWQAALGDWR
jgi:16S rRNA (uracil1498-N3)-methyltransferase